MLAVDSLLLVGRCSGWFGRGKQKLVDSCGQAW
jgi:hypothetical protein